MEHGDLDRELASLGMLADPVRRALYLHVLGASDAVGREEAAAAVGISRSLAAFHLDRLVETGLLEADFRRLTGRTGPGAGRPAKVYQVRRPISVTLPERDYEFAARLLIEAVREGGRPDASSISRTAHERGRAIGEEARGRISGRRTRAGLVAAVARWLEAQGFHPSPTGEGTIRLRNCPFDALAGDYPETMCRLNLSLIQGMLEGLGASDLEARPRPRDGACCVELIRVPHRS